MYDGMTKWRSLTPVAMKHSPIVLITGTSSGIGRAAAEALHAKGATVVATARNLDDIQDLADAGMHTMALDVTDDASMVSTVEAVARTHGRIDVLVNNAGYGVMLPLEELPMAQMRHMFDVNVFGLQRMTQLVLPHMRRQGSVQGFGRGRIVNVSSAAGHVALPIMGAYCATKFSVRALSWALRGEVHRFGIRVSLIEPGAIRTRFGHRSVSETEAAGIDVADSPYAAMHHNWDDVRFNAGGGDVRIISRRIVHACTARRPRFHYLAPYDARGARFAARFMPDTLTSVMTRLYFWRGTRKAGNDVRRES